MGQWRGYIRTWWLIALVILVVVIGVVASDAIGTKTVFVDDMEEEAHAAELSRTTAGFQVTKP